MVDEVEEVAVAGPSTAKGKGKAREEVVGGKKAAPAGDQEAGRRKSGVEDLSDGELLSSLADAPSRTWLRAPVAYRQLVLLRAMRELTGELRKSRQALRKVDQGLGEQLRRSHANERAVMEYMQAACEVEEPEAEDTDGEWEEE